MTTRHLVLPLLLAVTGIAAAQEMPKPAPELQKLAPLIGSWRGTGTAEMGPGEPSKWESQSTYAWALGNFYVQEDTVVRFEGMPRPLVMRSYLGWDAERRRYVAAGADNDGTVAVRAIEFAADGTMVHFVDAAHEGQRHLERYTRRIDGDVMTFAIDVLGTTGPSAQPVQGTMKRAGQGTALALDASAFTASPAPAMLQLGRTAGTYSVKATMVMSPGMPAMDITGQDEVQRLFDGTIVHVHTTGTAEGSPEQYVGELFYGFDPRDNCIRAVYVSNMGEVGEMSGCFTADGSSFVLTGAPRHQGQLCVQRMTMELGPDGAMTKAVGHTLIGTAPPYESWNATYTRK